MSAFVASLEPYSTHVFLLLIAGLASLAVAVGIVMESPKWSMANVLVVGGVAIEAICTFLLFLFDEGISSKQQSIIDGQQKKILALETKLAPRELSDSQLEALTEAAKAFATQQYTLSVAVGSEPSVLVCKLDSALQKGGWVRHASIDIIKTKPCAKSDWEVGLNLLSDIHIRAMLDSTPKTRQAAQTLVSSLKLADLEAYVEIDPINIHDPNIVAVMVGAKL
jgi:hypothetical protein